MGQSRVQLGVFVELADLLFGTTRGLKVRLQNESFFGRFGVHFLLMATVTTEKPELFGLRGILQI